jgi:hypothetical protein
MKVGKILSRVIYLSHILYLIFATFMEYYFLSLIFTGLLVANPFSLFAARVKVLVMRTFVISDFRFNQNKNKYPNLFPNTCNATLHMTVVCMGENCSPT